MLDLLKRILILGGTVILLASIDASSPLAGTDIYTLGPRDKLRVTVFGEKDLSGTFEVDSGGWISMPLIGEILVAGLTVRQLEKSVRDRLLDGYLRNPLVSGEVLTYRPFFIDGEVDRPGEYAASQGMTVREAVALAGGFKFWADKKVALMTRRDHPKGRKIEVSMDATVYPGDYIWVRD